MRRTSPVLAAAALSLALAACSGKTEKTAAELAQSAASDAAGQANRAGDAVAGAAATVGAVAATAARDTAATLHDAGSKIDRKADAATEPASPSGR